MNCPTEVAIREQSDAVLRVKPRTPSTLSPYQLILLVGVYFIVVAVGLAHHEMWRDELQAWMLARDSHSIPDLLHNMRYEGHPAAWHVLLFLVSRFTRSPVAMQILHLVLATATIFVIVRWAPFTVLQKFLLAFGYFFVYEYAVISRSYVLGALALFSICAVFPSRKHNYLPIALLLAVLANSSVYGLILAFALGITLSVDWIADRNAPTRIPGSRWKALLAAIFAVTAGMIATVQMIPPPDAAFTGAPLAEANWRGRVPQILSIPLRAYIPVPLLSDLHNWNTNLLVDSGYPWHLLAALLSLVLFVGMSLMLLRFPYALLLFALGSGGIMMFTYLRYIGSIRHHGHLFLLLLASLWIARASSIPKNPPHWLHRFLVRAPSPTGQWLTVILIIHVVAGSILYSWDLRKPFSAAQHTAKFIESSGLATLPIVATSRAEASALAGYLDQEIFYLDAQQFGTFVVWGQGGRRVQPDEVMHWVRPLLTRETAPLLLVVEDSIPWDARGSNVQHLAYFPSGIVYEQYHLYLVHSSAAMRTVGKSASPLCQDRVRRLSSKKYRALRARTETGK